MNPGATSNPGTSQTLVPHTGHGMHARIYIARSEILPLVLLANVQTPPGEISEGRQGFRYSASSCAGAI
jgi:hypothetical protein